MSNYKTNLAASELTAWRTQATKAQVASAAYRRWVQDRQEGLVPAAQAATYCVGGCGWRDQSR